MKPLLRTLQCDPEYLILDLENDVARLYYGTQKNIEVVDTVFLPGFFKQKDLSRYHEALKSVSKSTYKLESLTWIDKWIEDVIGPSQSRLFLAGDPRLVQTLKKTLRYRNKYPQLIAETFSMLSLTEIVQPVRKISLAESKKNLSHTLSEFRRTEKKKLLMKNIFQISRAAVRGKVRKLLITDELNCFGKIDPETGGVVLHNFDLDHEDDCILDDLAQIVLKNGGKVTIANKKHMPEGLPILAIYDHRAEDTEQEVSHEETPLPTSY